MRRIPIFKKMKGIIKINTYEGELIEDKVRRLTENKEPIKDSAPLVYTKKADGVLPQYNIRTDKWELVQGKMEDANKQKILRAKGLDPTKKTEKPTVSSEGTETPST